MICRYFKKPSKVQSAGVNGDDATLFSQGLWSEIQILFDCFLAGIAWVCPFLNAFNSVYLTCRTEKGSSNTYAQQPQLWCPHLVWKAYYCMIHCDATHHMLKPQTDDRSATRCRLVVFLKWISSLVIYSAKPLKCMYFFALVLQSVLLSKHASNMYNIYM